MKKVVYPDLLNLKADLRAVGFFIDYSTEDRLKFFIFLSFGEIENLVERHKFKEVTTIAYKSFL